MELKTSPMPVAAPITSALDLEGFEIHIDYIFEAFVDEDVDT